MSSNPPPQPTPTRPVDRVRSFLGYAFLISLLIHVVTLPFFGLKPQKHEKDETQKISQERVIRVKPTPKPTPTPTQPPPSPTPKPVKQTPPPVKQTQPPVKQLVVHPPKTNSNSKSASSENRYVPPPKGDEGGVPRGNGAIGKPAPVATAAAVKTGPPATAAPPPPPTPTPTPPAPKCAVPNADATTVNAADADYPDIARQQGVVGSAAVKVTLDATGHVTGADINKSAGNAALDQSAIKAARASTYKAEVVSCVPTAGSYIFRVDFTGQ